MNSSAAFWSLYIFLPLLVLNTSGAEPDPRYNFQEGATNAFRVTIESPTENNRLRFEGVILVGVRTVEENVATVFFRGRLQPKMDANAAPVAEMPMFNAHGPFGHMAGQPIRINSMPLPPFNEAQIDHHGRILRVAGLPDLPKPLENVATILFPPLPLGNNATNLESTVVVHEDSTGRGGPMHGGFHPGMHGAGAARLSGTQKQTMRKLEPTNGLARFFTEVEFRSYAKTDDEPRLAMKSKSNFILDPTSGMLHRLELQGNSTTSTLDMARKASFVVTVEKVEGDELAKAIAEAAARTPTLTERELDAALVEIKGDDRMKRTQAAQRLLSASIDQHAKKMLPVMIPFLNDDDHVLKSLAARVLSKAATEEHLPMLNRMLKQEDMGQQHEVIQALGRIGHKESIQTLADLIAFGSNNSHAAAQALGQFGSAAEDAALDLLKEKHLETRRQACQILNRVGSSKSIDALQAVIAAGDPQLIHDATEAVRAIRQRSDESAKLLF